MRSKLLHLLPVTMLFITLHHPNFLSQATEPEPVAGTEEGPRPPNIDITSEPLVQMIDPSSAPVLVLVPEPETQVAGQELEITQNPLVPLLNSTKIQPSTKNPLISDKLNIFLENVENILGSTMTEDSGVAPAEELEGHNDIMDSMFYLIKTRCYVVNSLFANYLRYTTQIFLNLMAENGEGEGVPTTTGTPTLGTGTGIETDNTGKNSPEPEPEPAVEDYQVEDMKRKKRRKRDVAWDSATVSIQSCLKITREIIYNLNPDGIPTSWYHMSSSDRVVNIAPPRETLFEKVLYINPIIEGFWQVFLFTATACNDQLRKHHYSVDNFAKMFLLHFGPTLKENWLDDKNYTFFYKDLFKGLDYKREIQKIKACNYAYQNRNPDFIVPRRPLDT